MPNPSFTRTQVLIIGAGPVGLTLACDLMRRGIHCRIIDQAADGVHTSRAAGIVPRTMEMFAALGLAEEFLAAGRQIGTLNIMSETGRLGRLPFEDLATPYPFMLMVPQSETERLLGERLKALGGRVERGLSLLDFSPSEDGVRTRVRSNANSELSAVGSSRDTVIQAAWLVGCDGAHSTVRKVGGFSFSGSPYPEHLGLADCEVDVNLAADQGFLFMSAGGLTGVVPFKEPHRYRIFAQLPPSFDRGIKGHGQAGALAAEDLVRVVAGRLPHLQLKLHKSLWSAVFRVHRRAVDKMREGRVLLAGDAAHIQSPAGGQGMNVGIQDAFNLGWKLALVCRGEASEELLDSYDEERLATFAKVSRGTDFIMKAMTLRHPLAQSWRNEAAKFVLGFAAMQQKAAATLAEIDLNYRRSKVVGSSLGLVAKASQLVEEALGREGLQPGDRAPDIALGEGGSQHLHGLLSSGRHLLLLFSGASGESDALMELAALCSRRLGELGEVLVLSSRPLRLARGAHGLLVIHDEDALVHKRFGVEDASFVMIRPDGYIGWRGANNQESVEQYFAAAHIKLQGEDKATASSSLREGTRAAAPQSLQGGTRL